MHPAPRALTLLNGLLLAAVAISIVHYADNYLAYDQFPQTASGPTPSAEVVLLAWFVLTPFAVAGYLLYRRGSVRGAGALLAVYSLSGLVGIGHYAVAGMTEVVWWRQAHVIADVLLGAAVLAFAVWTVRAPTMQRR